MSGPLLTREQLLAARPPEDTVPVPALGGAVRLRGLMAVERDALEASAFELQGKVRVFNRANWRARVVARCAIDDAGARLFTDADVEALGQSRADVIDQLYDVAARLSGIARRDEDELGKASGSVPRAGSSSSSPESSGAPSGNSST